MTPQLTPEEIERINLDSKNRYFSPTDVNSHRKAGYVAGASAERLKAKALLEALEEISVDKYPEKIFKPIPDEQWAEIASYIERRYSLDAISAHYGRIFHKMHREIAETTINNYKNSK